MDTDYQRQAQGLRRAGMNDGAIMLALAREGVAPDDAERAVRAMGSSFELSDEERRYTQSEGGGQADSQAGLMLGGAAMVGLGVLFTVVSYSAAAPGGSYVVTWGLVVAGVVRVFRALA